MPIYPVIYYNAIVASAMDPFHTILLTGNNRWKNIKTSFMKQRASCAKSCRHLRYAHQVPIIAGLSVGTNRLVTLQKVCGQ